MQYSFNLKEKHALTLGATYSLGHEIGSSAYKIQQMTSSSTVMQQHIDTIGSAFELPQKIGVGLTYVYDNRLTIGADYSLQQWSGVKFPHFQTQQNSEFDTGNSENDYEQWKFNNLSRISVGAEYVPNPVGRGFFQRLRYRVGAYYSTPYIQVKNSDMREFGHTVVDGKRRLRMHYVTQTGTKPPTFTFFVNHTDLVSDSYRRYIENRMREAFGFKGTPIRLRFRKKEQRDDKGDK